GVERLLQAAAARVSRAPVVLAAVPTLFGPDGELDRDANRALYKLIAGLLDGMLVAGTTGEFPALEDDQRLRLAEQALAGACAGGGGGIPGGRQEQRVCLGRPGRVRRGRARPADLLRQRRRSLGHYAGRRGGRDLRAEFGLPGALRGTGQGSGRAGTA